MEPLLTSSCGPDPRANEDDSGATHALKGTSMALDGMTRLVQEKASA